MSFDVFRQRLDLRVGWVWGAIVEDMRKYNEESTYSKESMGKIGKAIQSSPVGVTAAAGSRGG